MPINGYNTGRDVAVNFNIPGANLGNVVFSNLTTWESRQVTKRISSHGLDGITRYQEIPDGWEGSFEIDRADQNMDIAMFALENLYFTGQPVPASTITETIQEPLTGSITQWRYNGVMFKFDEHGKWTGDGKISQKVSFCASNRMQVR